MTISCLQGGTVGLKQIETHTDEWLGFVAKNMGGHPSGNFQYQLIRTLRAFLKISTTPSHHNYFNISIKNVLRHKERLCIRFDITFILLELSKRKMYTVHYI